MTSSCQDKTDSSRVSTDNEDGGANLSPNTSTPIGQNEFNDMCNSPCTPLLQKPADGSLQCPGDQLPGLRGYTDPLASQLGRAEMVGYGDVQMEWEDSPQEGDRHDYQLRCITAEMGSSLWNTNHKGSMVTEGGNPPHQLFGVAGSNTSSTIICKKQVQTKHPAEDRRYHSSCLHQPSGGDSLKRPGQSDKGSVDVVSGGEYTHHSSTPPWNPEHYRRCRITSPDGQDRLEAVSLHIPQNTGKLLSTGSGSLCDSSVCPVPTLLQLAARSICRSNRRISPSVDPHQGVCQPTMESDRPDTFSGRDSTSQHSAGSTSVEIPTMVSHTPIHVGGFSQTNNNRNRDNGQQGQLADAPTTSRMAYLRERYRGQQLSEEATELMLSSWRTKTKKSYDSLFTRWHCWCSERGQIPFVAL